MADDKKRKEISNDDVVKALKEAGFDSYVSTFQKALDESKTN